MATFDRHLEPRMLIAIHDDLLIAKAVPAEGGDIKAAIAAEGARAGFAVVSDDDLGGAERQARQFDPDRIHVLEVYLSDVEYEDLHPIFTSGQGGRLQTEVFEFRFAYDVDEAEAAAVTFIVDKSGEVDRLLCNLTYANVVPSAVQPWRDLIGVGELQAMDALEMRRAFALEGDVRTFVQDYVNACDCQPEFDDVLKHLEENGRLPDHEYFWIDPMVIVVAALAAEIVSEEDIFEEAAEASLAERDPDLTL